RLSRRPHLSPTGIRHPLLHTALRGVPRHRLDGTRRRTDRIQRADPSPQCILRSGAAGGEGLVTPRKVLVANRGEIAVRAFRAAYELGAATVAVYPYEDRHAVHRSKADEAYEIGERGHPVRAYLDIDSIVDLAESTGADTVYPGYGF